MSPAPRARRAPAPAARPPRLLPAPALLLLAALLPALAGCARDADVLARVGPRTITRAEFVEVGRGNDVQYPGAPDSAKAMMLEDLVRRALLLVDAERRGLFRSPIVANFRRTVEDEILLEEMFRRLAPADVGVSEAEIAEFHAWRDSAAHVQIIFCLNRGAADVAMADLARGVSFGAVSDRYGLAGVLPPGGDLGFVVPGALVPPLDRLLREGPLNTVIGPVEASGEGWFILQILERRARAQAPLDQQRPMLREMIRQRKQRLLGQRAVQKLAETYRVKVEPGGPQVMFAHFNRGIGLPPGAAAPPDSAATAAVLARYEHGGEPATFTLADALDELNVHGREGPNMAIVPAIERWIQTQVVRRVALLEARRRHIASEPAVARRLEQRVEGYVLNAYYDAEIAPGEGPSDEDVREAYERTKEAFQRLDEVRLLEVTVPDSAAAAGLVARAGHAPSLREAVAAGAPGARVIERTVPFPDAPEVWKPLQATFMRMSPRECVGPIRTKDGWLVAQMVSKKQEAQAFESLPPAVVDFLRQQAGEIQRDRKLRELTEALRAEVKPRVHAERLRSIPWPIPGPAGAARG